MTRPGKKCNNLPHKTTIKWTEERTSIISNKPTWQTCYDFILLIWFNISVSVSLSLYIGPSKRTQHFQPTLRANIVAFSMLNAFGHLVEWCWMMLSDVEWCEMLLNKAWLIIIDHYCCQALVQQSWMMLNGFDWDLIRMWGLYSTDRLMKCLHLTRIM